MSDNNNLLKLFQKPFEPSFFLKDDGKTLFNIPSDYYTDRYKSSGVDIQTRFGDDADNVIEVERVTPPDIKFAMAIPQNGAFSLFNENHRQIAGDLIQLFMDQPTVKKLLSIAVYCKDRLNPYLFQYALSVAIYHRKDTENDIVPSIIEIFPDQFFDPAVFPTLREEGHLPDGTRMEVEIPRNYTASDEEPEQKLAYFREDIGVNAHHWHWHLVYPGRGPESVVNKDRRGELFFEMHSQIMARYNVERMAAGLPFVKPLGSLREPIAEAYFPKLLRSVNNRTYCPRTANSSLSDVDRQEFKTTIANMERWRDRVLEAIDSGFAIDKQGNRIRLDEEKGIDILGNMLESSILSINPDYYGSFHNHGHSIIGYIHDPDGRHLEDYGIIGDVTTSMRDPAFYRLHANCDDIWLLHKNKLPQYPRNKLEYQGITANSIDLQITKGNRIPAPNTMLTFWQKSSVNLGSSLDFGTGNVYVSFTHLQYAPFNYRIRVTNSSGAQKMGTCRIYCCPKYKKDNVSMNFEEKRYLMIEMDKFTVTLKPGENIIVRRSDESSITIPFERTFKQQPKADDLTDEFRFCGCGWPQHMLLPKGTAQGMVFEYIVQISNFNDDIVDGPIDPSNCGEAHSYCGLRNKKFPDKRSMGYPFDRVHPTTNTLEEFMKQYSNFATQDVVIRFVDKVLTL